MVDDFLRSANLHGSSMHLIHNTLTFTLVVGLLSRGRRIFWKKWKVIATSCASFSLSFGCAHAIAGSYTYARHRSLKVTSILHVCCCGLLWLYAAVL
jgi:O-antigen ligase